MSTDRRNFILHVLNGVLFFISEAFTDPNLVVTAFLSQLTPSNVLIGLLAPLRDTGWFLPQLFISPWVERQPVKVRVYATVTYFRSAGWILLVISMFLIDDLNVLLIAFFACMLLISLSAGFAGLPYMTVTQKVIPKDRLGLLFGLRLFIGGGLSILASGMVGVVLAGNVFGLTLRFPDNYALLFAIATVFFIAGCVMFTFIKEKPDEVPAKATPMKTQFSRAGAVLKGDPRFLKFLSMRIALMFALTSIPFVTVYAKRELQVSDATIGALVPVALIAGLLSNLIWARINDRRSSRVVLAMCSIFGLVLCSIALALVQLGSSVIVLLPAAYALGGIITSGIGVSTTPQMIEIVPAGQGPLYFGLLNTLLGIAMLFTSLVGLLVDHFGYTALFLFCMLCFSIALERVFRLRQSTQAIATAV
jgi:MFS family permease